MDGSALAVLRKPAPLPIGAGALRKQVRSGASFD
jgi:hypothetical protein